MLAHPFKAASFDLVTAVASLHHVHPRAGFTRLRDLGGTRRRRAVIGLARPDLPREIPVEVAGLIVSQIRRDPKVTDPALRPPMLWPPPERYATMRHLATELLPGVRWQRHLRRRYSLVWTSPG